MIKSIGGLALPPSVKCVSELINRDSTQQTVSGRLVSNLDINQKWKITVSFDDFVLSLDYQQQFFAICSEMRRTPAEVVFVSPYDNQERVAVCRCTEIKTPTILAISQTTKNPYLYEKIGCVLQEV